MRKILILLSLLYTFILSLNYLLGVFKTPPGYLFLGTVHYPTDYLYYLSQFTQGKEYWFGTLDLYTSEKIQPMFVWFTNVLTGHVLSLFNIPSITAYQLTVTLYTFLFFLLVIFLLESIFPKEKEARLIALIFLGIANVMPPGGSFFSNFTEPLTRFPRIPHHMLGLVSIIGAMLFVIHRQKQQTVRMTRIAVIGMALVSILLANISPIQWVLVCCTLLSTVFLDWIIHKKTWKQFRQYIFLPFVFLVSGIPMIIYTQNIFRELPLIQSAMWDVREQIRLSFTDFFKSFGPIVILAVLGVPVFLHRITFSRMMLFIYTVASIGLFVSPFSRYAGITNIRFISAVTILGESVMAAYFLLNIPIRQQIIRKIVTWSIIIVLAVFLLPLFIKQFQRHAYLDTSNSYIYLSQDALIAYKKIQSLTNQNDIVLVTWPFDVSFPALTGRRGFMGHPLLTIDSERKNHEAHLFFEAQIPDNDMHKFLSDNGITYVLSFTSVTRIRKPFLTDVYHNNLVTIYKVLPWINQGK